MADRTGLRWPLLGLWLLVLGRSARAGPLDLVAQKFTVPHDAYPGYAITKFSATGDAVFRLLETEFSPWFALLGNGLLMTTGNISHLADGDAPLILLEDHPDRSVERKLRVHVLDSARKLKFDAGTLEGRIPEHSPRGTAVDGLRFVTASRRPETESSQVTYRIVGGNTEGTFQLQRATANGTSGVSLVLSSAHLDREIRDAYEFTLLAGSPDGLDSAEAKVRVAIEDINDHAPMFDREDYYVRIMMDTPKFTPIAQVKAYDADGDKVLYKMTGKSSTFFVVPKTGEVFLIGEPQPKSYDFEVLARDDRSPSKTSAKMAQVHIEVSTGIMMADPQPTIYESNHLNLDGLLEPEPVLRQQRSASSTDYEHAVHKRHVKRAVRPTKTVEHRETDGSKEGQVVFTLDNETGREKFQLRDDNPWVNVDTNGAVRVKKKWDYEELGPEKSIDFWATITSTQHGGKLFRLTILPGKLPNIRENQVITWVGWTFTSKMHKK